MTTTESINYRALGVCFRSAVDLPGLDRHGSSGGNEYLITSCNQLGDISNAGLRSYLSEAVAIAEAGDTISIRYADGTRFEIDRRRREIRFSWDTDALTLEDVCTYLTGPVIGLVAGLEGFACFHGAAAVVEGAAVMVVAPSAAGKSTIAASFALEGFDVLSDDVCATRFCGAELQVFPAVPRVRLWPASVEMLLGDPSALPLLTPNWDKRYLDLNAIGRFAERPAPLNSVVVLDPASEPDSFTIERMTGANSVLALLGNSYPQNFRVASIEPLIFEAAAFIARSIPVRRIPAYLPPRETVRRIVATMGS